ncbi:hypothetical protein [Mycobacterium basiliense]|uniref:hypothetical protein n=1 Tax=Mycobacterium basiliense TaxID=2094119 RepID=UPI001E5664BD|nr:hypothetical protein [Mycobacterium basiliense]
MNGPPQRESRPADNRAAPATTPDTDTIPAGKRVCWLPCTWEFRQDVASQWRRRRVAAARSVPLDCGCRDPLPCRCTQPPLSEHAVDSWIDTILHLLVVADAIPSVPFEVLRELWRRGGADRALAEHVHRLSGQVIK